MNIGIVTPTYNRATLLGRLMKSLEEQNDRNFIWIIIDDGSVDGTEGLVINKFKKESTINIRYKNQVNGGKARALNNAFRSYDDIDLFVVVDSDDILLPSAISDIRKKAIKYEENKQVGAIYFRYKDIKGNILHSKGKILTEEKVLDRIEHDSKFSKDDGCICYYRRAIKKYLYPEYKGEKYVGPIVIQMEMAKEFKIAFSNDVIGIAEYQENGLTNSGRKLRLQNPLGMIYYSGLKQSKDASLTTRIKNSIGAQAYRCISGLDKASLSKLGLTKYLKWWALVPGGILKIYWVFKLKKGEMVNDK